MTHLNKNREQMPDRAARTLVHLGEDLRVARTRRGWTLEEMARSMFVTRKTLSRLEKGDPGVGLSVLASALFLLGLEGELAKLADPGRDLVGLAHEKQRTAGPVRKKKSREDELDF